jgi:signal transduction histidine kinase
MVSHFLSLSRPPQKGEGSLIEVNEELERVIRLLRKGAPESVRIEANLLASKVYVRADERAMRQLLLNLLLNAREALKPEGGKVQVSLATRRNQAEVRITDNGTGIRKRDIGRIFEPFFSTKQAGTGLGLAISKSIVDNIGGEISLNSIEGEGTDVLLLLPTVDAGSV